MIVAIVVTVKLGPWQTFLDPIEAETKQEHHEVTTRVLGGGRIIDAAFGFEPRSIRGVVMTMVMILIRT
jgi:hypothetical protein